MANYDKALAIVDSFGDVDSSAVASLICKPFDARPELPPRKIIRLGGMGYYAKGFLSVTGAAGGTGKSSLAIVEELSLAMGVDLLSKDRTPLKSGRHVVWSMSLEDDETEHRRRVIAAMRYYNISPSDIAGHYYVTYKNDSPVNLVTGNNGNFVVTPQKEEIEEIVKAHGVGVINVDPFVNTHTVSENDNIAVNKVADTWRSLSQVNDVSIGLTHHIRKSNGTEVDSDSLRGAVSLSGASRIVRVLSRMSSQEAKDMSIADSSKGFYFWVNPTAKANIMPPASARSWFHMASVDLENGTEEWDSDNVGVCEAWTPPAPMECVRAEHVVELSRRIGNATDEFLLAHCRTNVQSDEAWIGYLVADIVGLDPVTHKQQVSNIIKEWAKGDSVLHKDKVKNANRIDRPVYRLGNAAKTWDADE